MSTPSNPPPRRFGRWRRRIATVAGLSLLSGLASATAAVAGTNSFTFEFVNGTVLTGSSDSNTWFTPLAGGTDPDNPTGMDIHVSCSDDFPNGFGEKDGPDPVLDSAWQIARYEIDKDSDGSIDCGDSFLPPPGRNPAIDLVKRVNGEDANEPTGPQVEVGDTVVLSYEVTNTGDADLSDIVLTDLTLGVVGCPMTELAVGESMFCDEQTEVVTEPGQVFMEAEVTGQAESVAFVSPEQIAAAGPNDDYVFTFNFVNGKIVTGSSEDNEPFVPEVGGTDPDNPTGTLIHVSCSDEFPGGFAEKKGPDATLDPAWQIASYAIVKVKSDGSIEKECGNVFEPSFVEVMDDDPIHYIAERTVVPPPPPEVCTTTVRDDGTVKISWSAVDGATRYGVFRDGQFFVSTSQLMTIDFNPPAAPTYEVRAATEDNVRSVFVTCEPVDPPPPPTLPPPERCVAERTGDDVKLTWSAVDGAARYGVFRNGRWLATVNTTMLTDQGAPAGATYEVRAATADGVRSIFVDCEPVDPPPPPSLPPPPFCTAVSRPDGVTVTFGEVDGATRYAIWRNGVYLDSTNGSPYLDPAGTPADTYEVRAAAPGQVKSDFTSCPMEIGS